MERLADAAVTRAEERSSCLGAREARAAGARMLVLPQTPGAVKGTDTYITHLDFLVTSLARALAE